MRRAFVPIAVLTAASALVGVSAGAAAAQSVPTNGAGLRYLSWPGKPPVGARSTPAPVPTEAAPSVVAVSRALPLARLAPPPAASASSSASSTASPPSPGLAASTSRQGLTPASAWTAPPTAGRDVPSAYPTPAPGQPPAEAQVQAAEPAPLPYSTEAQPVAAGQAIAAELISAPAPAPQQDQTVLAQAAPAPQTAPPASPVVEAAVQPDAVEAAGDPMAPRRDAPIFRLMRPQAGVAADGETVAAAQPTASAPLPAAPRDQTARYYSVHRQAGRQPDAIPAPQPTYLDALPVQMTQTPKSDDLAQPDGPPALIRNANGALRAAPQTSADDLP